MLTNDFREPGCLRECVSHQCRSLALRPRLATGLLLSNQAPQGRGAWANETWKSLFARLSAETQSVFGSSGQLKPRMPNCIVVNKANISFTIAQVRNKTWVRDTGNVMVLRIGDFDLVWVIPDRCSTIQVRVQRPGGAFMAYQRRTSSSVR